MKYSNLDQTTTCPPSEPTQGLGSVTSQAINATQLAIQAAQLDKREKDLTDKENRLAKWEAELKEKAERMKALRKVYDPDAVRPVI